METFKPGDKVRVLKHPVDNWAVNQTGIVFEPYIHPTLIFIYIAGDKVTACATDEIERVTES